MVALMVPKHTFERHTCWGCHGGILQLRATGPLASIELEWLDFMDMIGILQVDPWCYLTRKKRRGDDHDTC
jgi:hypothetical protein